MVENILIVIFTVLMLGGSILGFRLERGGEDEKEGKEKYRYWQMPFEKLK